MEPDIHGRSARSSIRPMLLVQCVTLRTMPNAEDLPEPTSFSEPEIRLIRGTYSALARHGTQQLSLRGIARELEVSPALLVYHFGNHENLLTATLRWAMDQTRRRLHERVDGIDDPGKKFTAFLDGIFVSADENREHMLIYLDLVQYAIRNPEFDRTTRLWRTYMTDAYLDVIHTGVQAGVFQIRDARESAQKARAIVEGLCLQWLQDRSWRKNHDKLRRDCEEALLALLRPFPQGESSTDPTAAPLPETRN
ncbi:TetR/AcrR family transcriptional regulator [Streptomyces sp. NPDC048002]|uniref:TetR/AcrR family transcriptional regulator n=1 Tax=Streptomyces sp. NPDC048002 TaxID=3154344 RepID=UPI0033FDF44F